MFDIHGYWNQRAYQFINFEHLNNLNQYVDDLFQALEQEVQARKGLDDKVCLLGQQLTQANHPSKNGIQSQLNSLQEKRRLLDGLIKERRQRLEDAAESYQVDCLTIIILLSLFLLCI